MEQGNLDHLAARITEQALASVSETELLNRFCELLNEEGISVASGIAIVDTLHPIWEGRAFPLEERWGGGRGHL